MKKYLLLFSFLFFQVSVVFSGEGMWLPLLLKALNEAEMQSMGMKLSAEDIYSINQGSLKDAIVHFGGFCTSEIISSEGLMLTNHHCGYGQIQSHSTVENNLLKDGFWAMSKQEELANPGLTATLIDRIEDMTERVLGEIDPALEGKEKQAFIDKKLEEIKSSMSLESYQSVSIKPFFHGNQYFAFITTTYRDIRLVGAPPESIGKFGADTDNWVWPRHTGDFSLFRIYAGPDNLPADYSEENIPYTPKHFLPMSLDGVEKGDFTMVFGFPGRTNEYLPSFAIEQLVEKRNPAKIAVREKALSILDKHMRADEEVRLKYASKFAGIANYWKKWIGESLGLTKTNAVDKKKKFEAEFLAKNEGNEAYQKIISDFEKDYGEIEKLAYLRDYYGEVTGRNVELMRLLGIANRMITTYENNGAEAYEGFKGRVEGFLEGFYKNYEASIDQEVFVELVTMFRNDVKPIYIPEKLSRTGIMRREFKSLKSYVKSIYSESIFPDAEKLNKILAMSPEEAIAVFKSDPAFMLYSDWKSIIDQNVNNPYNEIQARIDANQTRYMTAILKTFPDKRFYPDANSTMRVTYGQVDGYEPRDGVEFKPVTYLDGVMEKYKPGDYEFDVSPKLIELYENKDYGDYADSNGKIPICFLGSNHTTGGNSGSPAIDAEGNLIGLNFDRVWEGTMSDYNYDVSICRNIMVDVRYILFVVDKYAGAGHLIEEMELVHPKKK